MMKNQSGKVNSAMVAVITLVSVLWLGCQPPNLSQDGGSVNSTDNVNCTGTGQYVSVDYRRTLAEMIDAGEYYRSDVHKEIVEENFPIQRPNVGSFVVCVEIVLVRNDEVTRTDNLSEVFQYFNEHPELRYARIEELLAFGEYYYAVRQNSQVVAFGSGCLVRQDGTCAWPIVDSNDLGLGSFDKGGWGGNSSIFFLAVRK